ncbi:PAAR-like domain-containing protein [Serratia sp. L9]|uniref:PAAR-like domain-containing protein n=1 Tax=Serratia sp. L9 TaxID=3423946 RepID=UPI003D67FD47
MSSFFNNTGKGRSIAGVTPMIPIPGPNDAPNSQGIPNHANIYLCGAPEASVSTTRTSTTDAGFLTGAASGTRDGKMDPIQGSPKLYIQGSQATGMNDMSMTNNFNAPSTQMEPSQTKARK